MEQVSTDGSAETKYEGDVVYGFSLCRLMIAALLSITYSPFQIRGNANVRWMVVHADSKSATTVMGPQLLSLGATRRTVIQTVRHLSHTIRPLIVTCYESAVAVSSTDT